MADDRHFVLGSYYRICDRTGFKVRADRTTKEWNGKIVRDRSYEARHPQDLVTGHTDDQNVPEAKPRQIDTFIGPLGTTLRLSAATLDSTLDITNASRFLIGDTLRVMLDNGVYHVCTVADTISSQRIQISPSLPSPATAGNVILNITAYSEPDIG